MDAFYPPEYRLADKIDRYTEEVASEIERLLKRAENHLDEVHYRELCRDIYQIIKPEMDKNGQIGKK